MAKTFLIADTHFEHKNIIEYENRPFSDINEMRETMIKNWNSVVNKQDRVIVLGDFVFNATENLDKIVPRLRGNKVLVMGNHDNVAMSKYLGAGFREVYRYPIIVDNFWMLSHHPLYVNENMPYANIFGHVHSNPAYNDYTSQTMCVSVERKHMNYFPIEFEKAKKLMANAKE